MAVSAERERQTEDEGRQTAWNHNTDLDPPEEIRMVLIGKTGNGKSASGNSILNRNAFRSVFSPQSVTSACEKAKGQLGGRRVAVIDTPGIYDTQYQEEDVLKKLKECISFSAPGPHVFLIVIKLGRFTLEEQQTVELLQQVFGDRAAEYSLVLFTHGDQLRGTRIQDFFRKSQPLSDLIKKCNWRYHVFDNTDPDNRQAHELLEKVVTIVRDNGGTFYTNAMFREAERAIQEKEKQIMKEGVARKLKQEEDLRAEFEGEMLQDELDSLNERHKTESREGAERKNEFIESGLILTGAEAGVAIGAAAGSVGGPLCTAVGAVVGGAVGAVMGVLTPAAVKSLRKKCTVQ
ncbi:gimap4 [Pungitius sinensis]